MYGEALSIQALGSRVAAHVPVANALHATARKLQSPAAAIPWVGAAARMPNMDTDWLAKRRSAIAMVGLIDDTNKYMCDW